MDQHFQFVVLIAFYLADAKIVTNEGHYLNIRDHNRCTHFRYDSGILKYITHFIEHLIPYGKTR